MSICNVKVNGKKNLPHRVAPPLVTHEWERFLWIIHDSKTPFIYTYVRKNIAEA